MIDAAAIITAHCQFHPITREQCLRYFDAATDLDALCQAADTVRAINCGGTFDLCTIINGKSGRCAENCRFCAQSAHYNTQVDNYALLPKQELIDGARYNAERGVLRYSIVTAGRTLAQETLDDLCAAFEEISASGIPISLCGSNGLLTLGQLQQLHAAGVTRYHNNLETSRRNFPSVCTTHTYDDKIATLQAARQAGMDVCSGGIFGMGETAEDRIDMLLDLQSLGVTSVPLNFLTPIPGTPYENLTPLTYEQMLRIIAVARLILPTATIRLAAGRDAMPDHGRRAFQSGANGAITGDMLTTAGVGIKEDIAMLRDIGYIISLPT